MWIRRGPEVSQPGKLSSFTVVAYDVPDDRRRTRLFKTLRRFGEPVQFSVFECILSPEQVLEMQAAVDRVINGDEDNVRYYDLCQNCHRRTVTLGKAVTTLVKRAYII